MNLRTFPTERRTALRRQLVSMAAAQADPDVRARAVFSAGNPPRRRLGLTVAVAGSVLAGAAAAVIALAPTPADNSQDASRIIASLSTPQQSTDKPAAEAMAAITAMRDIDPAQVRYLGRADTLTYYGAPAGDKICMFPVDAKGESGPVGCTLLKSFESYGLRLDSADRTESGWLVVPAGARNALDSVKNEGGWSQQAPNFLVRTGH